MGCVTGRDCLQSGIVPQGAFQMRILQLSYDKHTYEPLSFGER